MSNTKFLVFLTVFAVVLTNCAPLVVTPTPIDSIDSTPTPNVGVTPSTGYQPVEVDHVETLVGVGSPIPVQVIATGNLPDTCAQIEYTEIKQAGSSFSITLSAIPSNAEGCVRDTLPFRVLIPLNIVNLAAGSYSVEVNGSRADFKVETVNATSTLPTANSEITKDAIQVDSVNMEIGVGSPIPVHAVVGLNLPNTCAQVGEIRMHRAENTFFVQLIADITPRPDCQADSIPFRLEIPLNVVNLPEGSYEVNVNGVTASFDPYARPADDSELITCSELVTVPVENGQVNYKGISFVINPVLAHTVEAQSCQTVTLSENQAPYTVFFPGSDRAHSASQPEIRIYEVDGDMQGYRYPLDALSDLQSILDRHAEPVTWFAAPLHARETYLDFANGTGVRGLVQYMQDFFFFNNDGLIYEFHGITFDGRHFVSVRYPVRVPFLMELDGPQLPPMNLNPQAITIPEWPNDFEQQRQIIETYNTEAIQRFEQMSDGDAFPNLGLLDQMVQSIQVNQP